MRRHYNRIQAADVALVSRWMDLNRDVIIDYWHGVIDFDEVTPRLQQVQPQTPSISGLQ